MGHSYGYVFGINDRDLNTSNIYVFHCRLQRPPTPNPKHLPLVCECYFYNVTVICINEE